MASQPSISTWMYCEQPGSTGVYAQVNGDPSTAEYQAVYWRCAVISLLSARIAFPRAQLSLYTNVDSLPVVDGVDLQEALSSADVEMRHVALMHEIHDEGHAWRNQFYVFDILADMAVRDVSAPALIITDGDCVWMGLPEDLVHDVAMHGSICYRIDYPDSYCVNGLSLAEARGVREQLGLASGQGECRYYGGELIAVTPAIAERVCSEFKRVATFNESLALDKDQHLTEEAHMLSAIYDSLGVGNSEGNRYIKRMWTSLRCKNIERSDWELPLWHLPAEKEYAFQDLWYQLKRRDLLTKVRSEPEQVHAVMLDGLRRAQGFNLYHLRWDSARALLALRRRLVTR